VGSFVLIYVPVLVSIVETMAAHRANSLLAILPNALETGFLEVDPEPAPLKVRAESKLPYATLSAAGTELRH
jgi:hypothetical protein